MANPGLNRFRGDAASFSPSQQPAMHHMLQQQQQQQAHMYAHYMYAAAPQMVPNYYMNPYMMPNMPYDFSQYQGTYPYPAPQPQPYGAPPFSPTFSPANPYNVAPRHKVKLSKAAYAQKAADPNANFQPSAATVMALQQKAGAEREKEENEENGKENGENGKSENGQLDQNDQNEIGQNGQNTQPKNVPSQYPILFNCTQADLSLDHRRPLSTNQLRRLSHFLQSKPGPIYINHDPITIFNHNDDTRTRSKENSAKSDVDLKTKDKLAGNWASVLLQSAPKKKRSVPASTSSSQQPSTTTTTSNASIHPSPAPPAAASPEPIGSLVLRIMYQHVTVAPFKIRVKGLTNTGNICYMNAVLQVLLYCEPFNRMLKAIETKTAASLGKSDTPLLDATIKFFEDMSEPLKKALSPDDFYMRLIAHDKFSHLKWGQQEDAEEFLNLFLDGLREEFIAVVRGLTPEQVNRVLEHGGDETYRQNVKAAVNMIQKKKDDNDEGWNEVAGTKKASAKRTVQVEPSPISMIFGGQFRSVLQVPKSKEAQSITLDPFLCVPLDISDDSITTIEDAFVRFGETEELAFKEVVAKKQTFIDQLPPIPLIPLKRFLYQLGENAGGIEKLKKKVAYSHTLTLPNECLSPALRKHAGAGSKTYRLLAVVYHHGVGAEGGHYTCDVLRKLSLYDHEHESEGKMVDAEWIRIDDTHIEVVERDEVLEGSEDSTKNAYILMYQRSS